MVLSQRPHQRGRPRVTVQSIGPHTFALPDTAVTVTRDLSPSPSSVVDALRHVAAILQAAIQLPLLLIFFALWTVLVWSSKCVCPSTHRKLVEGRGNLPLSLYEQYLEDKLGNQRTLLLQHAAGRVLDVEGGCVGGGGGVSMDGSTPYLRRLVSKKNVSHLVVLEPKKHVHAVLRRSIASISNKVLRDYQITWEAKTLEEYAAAAPNASDCGVFDWIVIGNHILCSVEDPFATLQAVHRLVKTGGYVCFCEHVAACTTKGTGSWKRRLQDAVLAPWWHFVSGGCRCNRETLHAIEGMEGWEVISWEFQHVQVMGGPFVMAIAQKVAMTA